MIGEGTQTIAECLYVLKTQCAGGHWLKATLNYTDVFGTRVKISPSIGLAHDVSGWFADTVFDQGRTVMNLGLRAD